MSPNAPPPRTGGAFLFPSGYPETGQPDRKEEQQRRAAIARDGGVPLVVPDTVGLVSALCGAASTFTDITPVPPQRPRAIGLISQSGALGMGLAQAVVRGVSFSHVPTSGISCDVDMADFVAYLVEDPACGVPVRGDERVLAAAEMAWRADKPLVVYKEANGEDAAAAALSHTGSRAGPYAAYRAAFCRAGVVMVENYGIDDPNRVVSCQAPRIAIVAASGGAAIMAVDCATQHSGPLPQPNPVNSARPATGAM